MVTGNGRCSRSTKPKLLDIPKFIMRYWKKKCVCQGPLGGEESGSKYHWLLRDRPGTNLNPGVSGKPGSASSPRVLVVVDP